MRFRLTHFPALLLPVFMLGLEACGRPDAGNVQARKMTAAQRKANRAAKRIGGANVGTRTTAEKMDTTHAPFERVTGYVVRGTDESSFRACGSSRVHYLRMSPMAAAKIVQQYRFRSPKPLHPVYFIVKARVVPDTVTLGPHEYTSVIEVMELLGGRDEKPECAAPSYGSLVAGAAGRTTRTSGGDVP